MNIQSFFQPSVKGKDSMKDFPDPFVVPSNSFIPTSLDSALDFSLLLFYMNPTYRRASCRVISHFITDLDITAPHNKSKAYVGGADKTEKDNHYDFMVNQVGIFEHLSVVGQEWAAFGNSFWRMNFPFTRVLIDDRSGKLKAWDVSLFGDLAKYHYKEMMYEVPDPAAEGPFDSRPKIKLPFRDRPDLSSKGKASIRPVPLDPKRMFLLASHMSGKCQYIYRFEEWFIKEIQDGRMYQVNETPMEMLQAIANDQDFLFEEDEIFHFKSPTVTGLTNKGWGIPETLLNYRTLHQLQIYRKIDEQIGMDFMMPFRVFSPSLNGSNFSDSMMSQNLGVWANKIDKMIQSRRADPFKMHAFPFPFDYKEVGASGQSLVPKELIEYQDNAMLDSMGYPAELFRASLQVQQVPTAVRLFESSFYFIHRGFNRFCQWVSNKALSFTEQPLMEISLQKPSMADDLEARSVYLQLAAGGEISRAKAYSPWGIKDPNAEMRERMEEDIQAEKDKAKMQQDYEKEMQGSMHDQVAMQHEQAQAEAAQQAQMQGGAPPSPGQAAMPNPGHSPLDVMHEAENMAMEALGIEQDGERRKYLQQIAATNPTLHAAVKQKMEEIRAQGASMGRAQAGHM